MLHVSDTRHMCIVPLASQDTNIQHSCTHKSAAAPSLPCIACIFGRINVHVGGVAKHSCRVWLPRLCTTTIIISLLMQNIFHTRNAVQVLGPPTGHAAQAPPMEKYKAPGTRPTWGSYSPWRQYGPQRKAPRTRPTWGKLRSMAPVNRSRKNSAANT